MLRLISKQNYLFSTATSAQIKIRDVHTYLLDDLKQTIPTEITITRDQVLKHYRQMVRMRQMQLACDKLYKAKMIRGFCHLATGQQSIAQGMQTALTYDDPIITAYRCHNQAYKRGITIHQIISQMLGKGTGATKGKGGSMHYYKKSSNFYGGNGIVGAQIPVGTGLGFALKYQKKANTAAVMFGDGASNQGQLYQAMNMAKLWKLPVIYICQNNIYGMGTSIQKSSMNPLIYTRGDKISGIRCDGNNIFEVATITKWCKDYTIKNGPIFLQFMTYRYHGHSMSDPGTTYRSRQEIKKHRETTDPIHILSVIGLQNKLVSQQQLNKIEQEQYDNVQNQVQLAKADPEVSLDTLTSNVYEDNQNHFIRGKLYEESYFPKGQKY